MKIEIQLNPDKRWWQFWKQPRKLVEGEDYTVNDSGDDVTYLKQFNSNDSVVITYRLF